MAQCHDRIGQLVMATVCWAIVVVGSRYPTNYYHIPIELFGSTLPDLPSFVQMLNDDTCNGQTTISQFYQQLDKIDCDSLYDFTEEMSPFEDAAQLIETRIIDATYQTTMRPITRLAAACGDDLDGEVRV